MTDFVPPSTQRISDLLTGLLDDGYDRAVSPVVRAIAGDLTDSQLTKALDALDKEAARLEALGEKMQPDNPVFRMVMSDLRDTLKSEMVVINGVASDVASTGIDAAGVAVRQLAVGGLTDAQLQGVGMAWNTPDPEAVRALVDYTRTGAWRDMFAAYPDDLADTIASIAIRGMVDGDGPRAIARELRNHVDTLLPHQADSLMRTLQLTSYRDAGVAHRLSNADILSYQVRIAALDDRTCFPAGTRITTSNGDVAIENIKVGDLVLTHEGRYKRVKATMKRDYSGQMNTVQTGSNQVTATSNHPVLVLRNGHRDWIPAESLKVGDVVFIHGKHSADDLDHIVGDRTVERYIGNSDNAVSVTSKSGDLTQVTGRALMPVNTVNFNSQIETGNEEINGVAVNAGLLIERLLQSLKTKAEVAFRFCFAHVAAVTARRAELLIGHRRNNSELAFAGQACLDHGRATAGFGAVRSAMLVRGSVHEHLTATGASNVKSACSGALDTAIGVSVSVRKRDGKLFVADGADLFNHADLSSTFRAAIRKVGITLGGFRWSKFVAFAAHLTGQRNALTLTNAHANTAAIRPVPMSFVDVGLPDIEAFAAHGTDLFSHDAIVSNTATQIKCEVYNFEVEEDHSYVANGVVVHNCLACLALHGKKYPIDQRIDDHYNGRCDSITVVKGFENERNIETGQQWFNALSPERQRAMMGNAAYEAYKAGEVKLDDFVGKRVDDMFGPQIYEQSLKGVLGDGAQRYYAA